MTHKLEKMFKAPSKDILDAILNGFRAQVDVKGKLAELYLNRLLNKLKIDGRIQKVSWNDSDGMPDFEVTHNGKSYQIECKNVRNEVYKKPTLAYKVEIQKTRNSKDGSNTRSYKVGYFDILAVCTFNQSEKWEFRFIKSNDLETVTTDQGLLKIMQRVPIDPKSPWTNNLLDVL